MEPDFWLDRWRENRTGFHNAAVNPLLREHYPKLNLRSSSRVFLPLCGKSLDIGWLRNQGHHVVGIELSELAVKAAFESLEVSPDISRHGPLTRYAASAIELYVGDFFELTGSQLGPIDAVYDRAALIALPAAMRSRYAAHIQTLCPSAQQLLISLTYDVDQANGPPFSLEPEEIIALYSDTHECSEVAQHYEENGLRGQIPVTERVWHLMPKTI